MLLDERCKEVYRENEKERTSAGSLKKESHKSKNGIYMGMISGGPTCMINSRRLVKIYRRDVVSSKMVKLVDWTHLVMYYT